jgi:hypothetical protein
MNLKYVYITFGQPTEEMFEWNAESRKKFMNDLKEKAKKERDVHMDFYGSPWGTTEGFVVIWKSDKPLSDFAGVNGPIPWKETRTVICMTPE